MSLVTVFSLLDGTSIGEVIGCTAAIVGIDSLIGVVEFVISKVVSVVGDVIVKFGVGKLIVKCGRVVMADNLDKSRCVRI